MQELKENLLKLFRADITLEVLIESNISKSLKYLADYCKLYESDLGSGEFRAMIT